MRAQLRDLGLRMEPVAADGNCFFRALSDQRWGDDSHHASLRRDVVEYMKKNRDSFEPFIEDDEKWDSYVARMAEDGAWAGNVELQAASVVCFANLCVHQAGQPRWEITNYPNADRFFHVAYQDGDHYNSVRLADDDRHDDYYYDGVGSSPGGPISLAGLTDGKTPRLAERPRRAHREPSGAAVAETLARAGGAGKKSRARELLRVFGGCVDSAATALKAEVSYKGVLRGGAGDDPVPGAAEALNAAEDGDGDDTKTGDKNNAGYSGRDDVSEDGSEDDWEPVVHKKSTRGSGGRRAGRRRDDHLDDRVAALRI